jgi:hypothetical protein
MTGQKLLAEADIRSKTSWAENNYSVVPWVLHARRLGDGWRVVGGVDARELLCVVLLRHRAWNNSYYFASVSY